MALAVARVDPKEAATEGRDAPPPIRLLESKILWGFNVYHRRTVVRQGVDLGALAGMRTSAVSRTFVRRFKQRFGGLDMASEDALLPEEFLDGLRSPAGVSIEEALLQAILVVDVSMLCAMRELDLPAYANVFCDDSARTVDFVWESRVPAISRAAAEVAFAGFTGLLPKSLHPRPRVGPKRFQACLSALRERAERRQRSRTTAVLMRAARRRGIPCEPLGGPYLRFGDGAQRRVVNARVVSRGELFATRAEVGKRAGLRRLQAAGFPVPDRRRVRSAEDVREQASLLGYPVVLRPLRGRSAFAVVPEVWSHEQIAHTFDRVKKAGQGVTLERRRDGRIHRMLVAGERMVAALTLEPPSVTGDGRSSVMELISALNSDPARNDVVLHAVEDDDQLRQTLALLDCSPDAVLPEGIELVLADRIDVARGAVHTDITDIVSPDNAELAIRAAAELKLDVAGVDLVSTDIARPYDEGDAIIVEVDARPSLWTHAFPRYGESRDAAGAVLGLAMSKAPAGRTPVALVLGDRGTQRLARELDALLRASGRTVGLAARNGPTLGGRPTDYAGRFPEDAARMLLRDSRVEAVVSTTSPRRVIDHGLRLSGCDVLAVTGPRSGADIDAFQEGVALAARATSGPLVVSAANGPALEALTAVDARRVIVLSARRGRRPTGARAAASAAVVIHRRNGRETRVSLHREGEPVATVALPAGPGISPTESPGVLETRVFAVAMAFGLGLTADEITAAVQRPALSLVRLPGGA